MLIPTSGQVLRFLGLLRGGQSPQKALSSGMPLDPTKEIFGGTPFRYCAESRDSDLFQISSAIINRQPIYIDDAFMVYLEGEFLNTFAPNATFAITGNCGSYCDAYNVTDPRDRQGETITVDFCASNLVEQPLGHHRNGECPPQKGAAMISAMGWAVPFIVRSPGYYNFTFDVNTKDGQRIYCLTAEVCLRWEDDERNERESTGPWGNCTWPQ